MNFFKKIFFLSVCALIAAFCFNAETYAQNRERVVKTTASQPTNLPPAAQPDNPKPTRNSRPTLTNNIIVVRTDAAYEPPTVKKTSSSMPSAPAVMAAAGRTVYGSSASMRLDSAIKSRYGLPYRYGSTGPNSYDCSGFVWSAFNEAGINYTRSSARSLWSESEPVEGADRYKYGTLVFLNRLGHVGIVADENGFYHASSSKGITYSPFKGYWENRIVGFRRLRPQIMAQK
ncbi:MAG: C40 family peptidase [Pyrinomonadaceae bacterium]